MSLKPDSSVTLTVQRQHAFPECLLRHRCYVWLCRLFPRLSSAVRCFRSLLLPYICLVWKYKFLHEIWVNLLLIMLFHGDYKTSFFSLFFFFPATNSSSVQGKRKQDPYVSGLGWPVKAPTSQVLWSVRLTSSFWFVAYAWTVTRTPKYFPVCTLFVKGKSLICASKWTFVL